VHILLAVICVLAFPVALVTFKGGTLHRRSGKVFLIAGLLVGLSSVVAVFLRSETMSEFFRYPAGDAEIALLKLSFTMAVICSLELWNGWSALALFRNGPKALPRSNVMINAAGVALGLGTSLALFHDGKIARAITSFELTIVHVIFYGFAVYAFSRTRERTPLAAKYLHQIGFVGSALVMTRSFLGGGPAKFIFPDGLSGSTRVLVALISFAVQLAIALRCHQKMIAADVRSPEEFKSKHTED
jgi:hypothetical protein